MKINNRSFNQILQQISEPNMQRLMTRAYIANRIAKSASIAGAKRHAYKVKLTSLQGLKKFFPNDVRIEHDFRQGSGIVRVAIAKQSFALHAPAENFALDA
jgi:hypothetical protein